MKTSNMKRTILGVIAILLLVSTVFSFAACGKGGETEKNPSNPSGENKTDDPSSAEGTLTVNGKAISDYRIVRRSSAKNGVKEGAAYLQTRIEEISGVKLDTAEAVGAGYEIVFGEDGGVQSVIDGYKNNPEGYIGVDGQKIYLLAPNYGAYSQTVDKFLSLMKEDTKEITLSAGLGADVKKASVKVLTYNVQQDLHKEGRRDDALDEMINTIKGADPDVFGTQEDTETISQAFLKGMPQYSRYVGADYQNNPEAAHDYVYWKTDKFNVIRKGFQYMSDTPNTRSKFEGSNSYRGFTYLVLEDKETGRQFLFINLHTHYRKNSDESSSEADVTRKLQLQVVTKFLQNKKINVNDIPTVILGDFNSTLSGSSIPSFLMANKRLRNTQDVAEKKGDTGHTLAITQFTVRDKYTFDYVFVTADKINTTYYSVLDNKKNGKYPSDHLPVVAHLEVY